MDSYLLFYFEDFYQLGANFIQFLLIVSTFWISFIQRQNKIKSKRYVKLIGFKTDKLVFKLIAYDKEKIQNRSMNFEKVIILFK